jgi:hypothetical protein
MRDLPQSGRTVYGGWQGSCLVDMGNIGNYRDYMNSSAHLAVSGRVRKAKAQKRTRGRPRKTGAQGRHEYDTTMAAAGTLTRTKALLLAALKVWELKHRVHDQDS